MYFSNFITVYILINFLFIKMAQENFLTELPKINADLY